MGLSKRQIFFHLKFYVFVLTDVYPVWLRNKYKINNVSIFQIFTSY
ncbi:succinate dehydrogenase [Escherichia coli]|nr:succinate dehydrogenase [Escherichia coli]